MAGKPAGRKIESEIGIGTLLGPASVYMLANVLRAVVPFALLPILTRYLTPEEYGFVAMFQVLVGFIGPLVGLNVHGAVQRRYYDRDGTDLPAYIGSSLAILFGSASAVAAALLVVGPWIGNLASLPTAWIWGVLVTALFQFLVQIRLVMWQSQVRPWLYGTFQVLLTVFDLAVSLWLVVRLGWGWEGRVTGMIVTYGVFGSLGLGMLAWDGWIKWRPRRDYMRNALQFGVPLVPHMFAAFALTATDQLFITNMLGVDDTGIYLVASQAAGAIGLMAVSANKAWTPWIFERLGRTEESLGSVVRVMCMAFFVIAAGVLILSVAAPLLLSVYVGKSFQSASQYISLLAIGQGFQAAYLVIVGVLFYAERTKVLASVTLATAALNAALNYPLILAFGMAGASLATALSFAVKFTAVLFAVRTLYPLPWLQVMRLEIGRWRKT